MGIDGEACGKRGGVGQRVACGRGREVARDIEAPGLSLAGALVGDRGAGRSGVGDGEGEALADALAMGIGDGDGDRVRPIVAIGRHAGDDAAMGIDGEACGQCGGEGQRIACGRRREVA